MDPDPPRKCWPFWALGLLALALVAAGQLGIPARSRPPATKAHVGIFLCGAVIGAGIALLFSEARSRRLFTRPIRWTEPFRGWRDVAEGAAFTALILAVLTFCWRRAGLTLALLASVSAAMLLVWRRPQDRWIFLWAAVLGPPMESLCIARFDFWVYNTADNPRFRFPWMGPGEAWAWNVPIWLPLVWGCLFTLFRRIALGFRGILRAEGLRLGIWLAALAYLAWAEMTVTPALGLIYLFFFGMMALVWNSESDLLMLAMGGILGTIGEVCGVAAGIWTYAPRMFLMLGIPVSLPIAWGVSGVILQRLAGTCGGERGGPPAETGR